MTRVFILEQHETTTDGDTVTHTYENGATVTHTYARALCEAGYMPLPEYIRLCELHGWVK